MTTPQATDGVPRSAQAAVHGHRLERVRGARRMVPADLAVERADQQAVGAQQTDQQILHRTLAVECSERRRGRCNRSRHVSRSVASWAYDAPAAAGRARTTSTAGPGSEEIRARVRCRRRRFTLLRVTALPTALLTTNPAWGPACSTGGTASVGSMSRCRTTVRVPARRPRRVALENKLDEVSRWWRSSTGSARPRSDRELAATLATARGQDGAAGAGTHPQAKAMGLVPTAVVRLERALAHGFVSGVCDGVRGLGVKGCVGWHRPSAESTLDLREGAGPRSEPRPGRRESRGHAAPVDTGSTSPRYAVPPTPVKPGGRRHRCGQPLDREATDLLAFCRPRDSPRSTLPAQPHLVAFLCVTLAKRL